MLGLLIAVIVVPASVHDNAIGITLLDPVSADNPGVVKSWVDAGFKNAVIGHGRSLGIDVEVVSRDPQTKGFAPAPKRWIAELTAQLTAAEKALERLRITRETFWRSARTFPAASLRCPRPTDRSSPSSLSGSSSG